MRKLRLTDGTEFEVDLCAITGDYLRIELKTDWTISALANVFDNAEYTHAIECYYEETDIGRKIYEGFTYLHSIGHELEHIAVMLGKTDT